MRAFRFQNFSDQTAGVDSSNVYQLAGMAAMVLVQFSSTGIVQWYNGIVIVVQWYWYIGDTVVPKRWTDTAVEDDTPGMGKITISDPDSVNSSIFAQTLAFWRDLNLTTRSSAQSDKTENLISCS